MDEITEGEEFYFSTFKFMATCKVCKKEYDLLEEKKKAVLSWLVKCPRCGHYYYKVIE